MVRYTFTIVKIYIQEHKYLTTLNVTSSGGLQDPKTKHIQNTYRTVSKVISQPST